MPSVTYLIYKCSRISTCILASYKSMIVCVCYIQDVSRRYIILCIRKERGIAKKWKGMGEHELKSYKANLVSKPSVGLVLFGNLSASRRSFYIHSIITRRLREYADDARDTIIIPEGFFATEFNDTIIPSDMDAQASIAIVLYHQLHLTWPQHSLILYSNHDHAWDINNALALLSFSCSPSLSCP